MASARRSRGMEFIPSHLPFYRKGGPPGPRATARGSPGRIFFITRTGDMGMSKVCFAVSIAILSAVLAYSARNDSALNGELIRAIRNNDAAAVKTVLRRGADANAKDQDGATPLMHAALPGDASLLKL